MPRTPKLFKKKKTIPPRKDRVTHSAEEPPISSVSEDLGTSELAEEGELSGSYSIPNTSANSSRPSTAEKKFGESVRTGYSEFQYEKTYDVIDLKEFGEAHAAVVRCKVCGGQVEAGCKPAVHLEGVAA
ncbi:hypothetical protein GE061_019232 [Apolygus lucorum]|uniref:Uncharacterized protein n=1 Tax=Apolygus lucorum TaxID=248454 RepID=A0A6A4JRM0_APOLU|nr:hypothetical protein GE061_019232 [Apolygus lucorum]